MPSAFTLHKGTFRRLRCIESCVRLGTMGSGPFAAGRIFDLLVLQLADCELAVCPGFANDRSRPLEIYARGGSTSLAAGWCFAMIRLAGETS